MAFTKNTYSITLDIKRRSPQRPLLVEGDTAVQLNVHLTDDANPMDITGLYVRVVFRRSDGRTVLVSESDDPLMLTVTKDEGKVVIDVPRTCYRDGDNFMEIQILSDDPDAGDVMATTAALLLRARNCLLTNEAVEESVEFPILQWFINALRDMDVSVTTLEAIQMATASLTLSDGAYHLALGIPRGASIISITFVPSDNALVSDKLRFVFDNGYVTTCDVPKFATQDWVSTQSFATQTWVTQQINTALTTALAGYVTPSDVANAIAASGHYTKPAGGIPKSDLSSLVQLSLSRADTALQAVPDNSVTEAKIADGAVSNDKLAQMEPLTLKGNNALQTDDAQDLSQAEVAAMFAMKGATSSRNGAAGFVPQPLAGDEGKYLKGDGTWATPSGGGASTTDDVTIHLPQTIVPLDTLSNGDTVSEAMAQVNNLVSEVADLDADKLDTNGDGSSVYATRGSASINYGDIPATDPVTLRDLLRRLGGWYAEINGKYAKPAAGIPASDLAPGVIPTIPVTSVNGQTGAVVLDAEDVGAQTPYQTATITLGNRDWTITTPSTQTVTVTGMTADSLVFVEYSDTETEFTVTQAANALTFSANEAPSADVTVKVAWFKEASA